MKVKMVTWWQELSPEAQGWIKGCMWAILTAVFNTLIASPFTTWKGMCAIAVSSAVTAFKLYKAHSPFPRRIWSEAERTAMLGADPGAGGANVSSTAAGK